MKNINESAFILVLVRLDEKVTPKVINKVPEKKMKLPKLINVEFDEFEK